MGEKFILHPQPRGGQHKAAAFFSLDTWANLSKFRQILFFVHCFLPLVLG